MSTIQTGITEQVIAWLFDHLPTVYAVGAAVSISALMSLYDGRTLVQTVTGSLACGVLAMAVATGLWHRLSVIKNPLQVELLRWSIFQTVLFIL